MLSTLTERGLEHRLCLLQALLLSGQAISQEVQLVLEAIRFRGQRRCRSCPTARSG